MEINLKRMVEYNRYNNGIAESLMYAKMISQEEYKEILSMVERIGKIYSKIQSKEYSDNITIIDVDGHKPERFD